MQEDIRRKIVEKALKDVLKYGDKTDLTLMRKILKIEENEGIECIWYVRTIYDQDFRHLTPTERMRLIRNGTIKTALKKEQKNKIMMKLKTAIIKGHAKTAGADDDLGIDYIALGTGDTNQTTGIEIDVASAALNREAYRATPLEVYQSGSKCVINLYLESTDANLESSTIASATDERNFSVQATKGALYNANDRIRVWVDDYEEVTVESVTTDAVLLKASTPLSRTPDVDAEVERLYTECAAFAGAATSTPGSGTKLNHAPLTFPKTEDESVLIQVHLHYISAV